MFGGPLPGENALARAANGVEQKNGVWVGRHGPVAHHFDLGLATYELVGADVGRFRVEGRWCGDGIGLGWLGRGIIGLRLAAGVLFIEKTAEASDGMDGF